MSEQKYRFPAAIHGSLDDAGLTAEEFRVNAHVNRCCGGDNGEHCFSSIETIAAKCRLHPDTVRRAMKRLKELGWIDIIDRPGRSRIYVARFPDPSTQTAPLPSNHTPPVSMEGSCFNGGHPPETKGGHPSGFKGDEVISRSNPKKGSQNNGSNGELFRSSKPHGGSCSVKASKAIGTIEELKAYAIEIGLPESDGESMFLRWEENGWMNGKNKVKCWRSGIKRWKINGWLPSQKAPSRPESYDLAVEHGAEIGVSKEVVTGWWDSRHPVGWKVKGQPLTDWKGDLVGYVEKWNENLKNR